MINRIILWKVMLLFLLVLILLPYQANAVLQVTFRDGAGAPLGLYNDRIDLFWAEDANDPSASSTRIISALHTVTISEGTPGKPDATPLPVSIYHFWSGATPVASQTNYLRVWRDSGRLIGNVYTGFWGYVGNNNYMGANTADMTVIYRYIKQNAGRGVIERYFEANDFILVPPTPASRRAVFTAQQPTSGVYEIQVAQTQWQINALPLITSAVGNPLMTLTMDSATYPMTGGETYTIKFRYRSYFNPVDNWGPWSADLPYTVGAAPVGAAGGGPITKTWTLNKTTTGINTLSIPFDPATAKSLDGAVETSRDITTVEKLINEIVRQTGGTPAVKVFGWFDSTTQTHKGLTSISYTGSTVNRSATTFTGGALIADILDATVTMDTPYQASVDRLSIGGPPLTFTLKGTRP